jgi:oligopeptide/dipeptide ABC transporter ATP-binding protein
MHRLDGKVALVTGSGRRGGLGEAICRRLAQAGASVVVTDLGRPAGELAGDHIGAIAEMEAVAAGLPAAGGEAMALPRLDDRPGTPMRTIAGVPPSPGRVAPGCAFRPRCQRAEEACRKVRPLLSGTGGTRVACHHPLGDHGT